MLEFWCDGCGAKFRAPNSKAGQTLSCQWCGHKQLASPPRPPPPAVPPPRVPVPPPLPARLALGEESAEASPFDIRFDCPHCDVRLSVGSDMLGKEVRCTACNTVVAVSLE